MTIDWVAFTPWSAVLGGVLIGLAAAALVLLNGRIAGVSGIIGAMLRPSRPDIGWQGAFLIGLVASPVVYSLFAALPDVTIGAGYPLLVAAGLAVGVGARYGSGCTSGHGVCGMSRLSARSLVATLVFTATGFATVFIIRHVAG